MINKSTLTRYKIYKLKMRMSWVICLLATWTRALTGACNKSILIIIMEIVKIFCHSHLLWDLNLNIKAGKKILHLLIKFLIKILICSKAWIAQIILQDRSRTRPISMNWSNHIRKLKSLLINNITIKIKVKLNK